MERHKGSKVLMWAGLVSCFLLVAVFSYAVGSQEEFPPKEVINNPSTAEVSVPAKADPPAEEGTIVVKFKATTPDSEQQKIEATAEVKVDKNIEGLDTKVLETKVGEDNHQMLSEFRQEYGDKIEYAELNGRIDPLYVPNDPEYPTQWGLPKIQAPAGWDKTKGSNSVTIAVLDTGVNSTHPDLANKVVTGYNPVDNNTDLTDLNGHGTLMMGIAGAQTGNALGIAGVGIEPKIMMIRISNNAYGWAYWSDMAEGIIWAADHGAKVLSISFGGTSPSATIQSAVDYAYSKGVFIAASAGNSNSSTQSYPAACNHVVAVGATDAIDQKASFSNYGPWVDVTSPGVAIKSTNMAGSYSSVSGTSPACPFVAGLASLILSQNSGLSPDQVESVIEGNTDDLGTPGRDDIFGWGRINANKALSVNAPTPPPLEYGNIAGKVTNAEDGSPLIGAKISALKDGKEVLNATTTADGSYRLVSLVAGSYTLIVNMDGFSSITKTGVLVTAGKTTEGTDFALQPNVEKGTISGTVYRQSYGWKRTGWKWYLVKINLPRSNTKVTVRMLSTPRRLSTIKNTIVTRTNSKGRYSVGNLPAGTYLVTASYFASYAYKQVSLGAGENKIVNLILSHTNWPQWVKVQLARQRR